MIPSHLRHVVQGRQGPLPGRRASGLLVRGVVLAVKVPGSNPARRNADEQAVKEVLCDVLVFEGRRAILRDVPILRQSGGVENHESWVPHAAAQDLTGAAMQLEGGDARTATSATDSDGDIVVVGFLNDDLLRPVILGQIAHPRTTRKLQSTDGLTYRRYLNGVEVHVTDDGDLVVTTDAYTVTLAAASVTVQHGPSTVLTVESGEISLGAASVKAENTPAMATALLKFGLAAQLSAALTEIAAGLATQGVTATTTTALATALALPEVTNAFATSVLKGE